jgi:hypothetical protein
MAISSYDNDSIEQLQKKITELEKLQERMKNVNSLARKGNKEGLAELGYSDAEIHSFLNPTYSYEKPGYPSWALTNNNQNINRLKKRIGQVKEIQAIEAHTIQLSGGVSIEANTDIQRVQIHFPDKPSSMIRDRLKANGYKWAPTEDAWQRHLTQGALLNAKYVCRELGFTEQAKDAVEAQAA